MPEENLDFASVCKQLNDAGVRYVVIGGLAMSLLGSAHVTRDIDIGYARTPENYTALANALNSMNARLRNVPADLPFILDAKTFLNTQNLTLDTDFAPFDLLGHISGIQNFEGLYERSEPVEIEGVSVRVASLDDLIAMKRAASRPKDRNHLMELEALKKILDGEQN